MLSKTIVCITGMPGAGKSTIVSKLEEIGLDAQALYRAAGAAAVDLPNEDYRKLSKTWAVRQHRVRSGERFMY